MGKLHFACDYQEGAYPSILKRLEETNYDHTPGYGADEITASAKERIRNACDAPLAEVEFLVGGTQTNAVVIDSLLKSYQGVITADTGHISVHEAGAIEFCGHKVLTLPSSEGKITAEQIDSFASAYENDGNRDHMVMPGMIYLSQPTELGTLYSLEELTAISRVSHSHGLKLYIDGARLAYALASSENTVSLKDLAKLCDVFYIGGTKCGALFGEAVVIPDPSLIPHFFTIIKQHGALLAKGRILGIQFDELFRDDLYRKIGASAVRQADQIRQVLNESGYRQMLINPTNQIFVSLENSRMKKLSEQLEFSFWEQSDENHTVIRLVTSWATKQEDTDQLIQILKSL
ncbi:MAG: beta-eliminating lyase-related protein [Stecheria intestinalis]|nr:beta-eliminating lyase-related protein [Stecheria intestinalis]